MLRDQLLEQDGRLRGYFEPHVFDSVYQRVARFLQLKRTAHSIGDYLARFDLLRRKAEPRMQIGGSSPETSVSILSTRNASPPGGEKLPILASAQRNLGNAADAR